MRLLFSALGAELPKGSLLYFVLPQLEPQSDAPRLVLAELFLVDLMSQFLQLDLFMFQIPPDFGMWKQSVGYAVLSREKVEK